MSIKKNKETVKETIKNLAGFDRFIGEGENGHGPTILFVALGTTWEYGYDKSPKAEYGPEKTRKAVRHSMVAKANGRKLTVEEIYKATEWKSRSKPLGDHAQEQSQQREYRLT